MKLSAPLFLGIDGGATQSLGVVVTPAGRVLATARAGSLNFLGSDLPTARRTLRELLGDLRAALPPGSELAHAVVGCAALFTDATPAEKRALCAGLLPLGSTRVVSDCQTAHFGATLGQPGVVIIAGTGSIVLARGERGAFAQTGGWGHLLGDEGSAWWIAREAIRAAIAAEEQRGPSTQLGRHVCRFFRVASLHAIAPLVHGPLAKAEVAALAAHLAEQVPAADVVFHAIQRRAGQELARQALAALRRAQLRTRPAPVYLAGSVLTKNRLVRTALIAALQRRTPVRIRRLALPPVLGAAAMSLVETGHPLSRRVVANLRRACTAPGV